MLEAVSGCYAAMSRVSRTSSDSLLFCSVNGLGWSDMPSRPAIERYLRSVAGRLDLRRGIRFGQRVVSAH
jgi:hypothetical protein